MGPRLYLVGVNLVLFLCSPIFEAACLLACHKRGLQKANIMQPILFFKTQKGQKDLIVHLKLVRIQLWYQLITRGKQG